MSKEPYEAGMVKESPFAKKSDVEGVLVAVAKVKLEERRLKLIQPLSRALLASEIHELIVTDEQDAAPGKTVDRVAVLGFFEVKRGGVIATGDNVSIEGKSLGEVSGFDLTHMPNHMNIVIKSDQRASGVELGLELGGKVRIGKRRT